MFAVAAGMLAMLVRAQQRELGLMVSLGAGLMLLIWALPQITSVKRVFERITQISGLNQGYLTVMLKVILVSYLSELAAQTCQDMGEGGLALKVALCGKLVILSLSAPLLYSFVELVISLLP